VFPAISHTHIQVAINRNLDILGGKHGRGNEADILPL